MKFLRNIKVHFLLQQREKQHFINSLEIDLLPLSLFTGEPFDTTQPMNYAVSNIICSIVYGSRFEYDDPQFTSLVDRTNRTIQLVGSPSIQVGFKLGLDNDWKKLYYIQTFIISISVFIRYIYVFSNSCITCSRGSVNGLPIGTRWRL